MNLWSEELLDHLPDLPGERHSEWKFPEQPSQGHLPAQNLRVREAVQVLGSGSGKGLQVGKGLSGVTTHKRTVEAARKAKSRRPAREERMEVMTIMSPLRRPGHVSMEPGDFPARTAAAQRLLLDPCSDPRPGYLLSPRSLLSPTHCPSQTGICALPGWTPHGSSLCSVLTLF